MDEIGSEHQYQDGDLAGRGPKRRAGGWSGSIGKPVAVLALLAGGVAAGSYGIASATASSGAVRKQADKTLAAASNRAGPTKHRSPWSPSSGRRTFFAPGDFGPSGFAGMVGGVGAVTAVTPGTITVKAPFGGTLTFSTSPSTVYREGAKTVSRSAVEVGEQIAVLPAQRSASESTSTLRAAADVEIVQPHVVGKVVKVSGTHLVVSGLAGPFEPGGPGPAGARGTRVTVNISTSTVYDEAGHQASVADLGPGTLVAVTGTATSVSGQIDATRIEILPASVVGRVTAISGTTITLRSSDGKAVSLTTDSSTVFRTFKGKATIASVAKGDIVEAMGKPGAGNSFSALTVVVGPAFPLPTSGGAAGGFFGRGPSGLPGVFGTGGAHVPFGPGTVPNLGAAPGGWSTPRSGVGSAPASATL